MQSNLKKAVHAGFAVVGGGVLVLTHLAAGQPAGAIEVGDGHPNPGLTDGEFTVRRPEGGPVRAVTINVAGGRIADITADYNDHNRKSHSLNTTAVLRLRAEAIAEQSADDLDFVTGATVTSEQFIGSLQEAIDLARP